MDPISIIPVLPSPDADWLERRNIVTDDIGPSIADFPHCSNGRNRNRAADRRADVSPAIPQMGMMHAGQRITGADFTPFAAP